MRKHIQNHGDFQGKAGNDKFYALMYSANIINLMYYKSSFLLLKLVAIKT